MRRTFATSLSLLLIVGCAAVPDRAEVSGLDQDELLKLRAGPGLGFEILLGLPEGTEVVRRDCVTEVGQRWCRVSPAASPAITGYVADTYLLD